MRRAGLHAELKAERGRLALDVELHVPSGTLVVVGPNGAGKTSLLSALLGVVPLRAGSVVLDDEVLRDVATGVDVAVERRRIGYVPQEYALFPNMTVAENVSFALGCADPRTAPADRAVEVAARLGALGLTPLASRLPRTLSGGEKQRVALARALAVRPRALLLDEPLAALDVVSRGEVRAQLAETLATLTVPTVVVTHDADDARRLGESVVVLEAGSITQRGTWDELAARPATPFVAAFTSTRG